MPASPSSVTITGPLMLGCRGKDVLALQSLLNQANVGVPPLTADGVFGSKTDAAVRAFQKRKGLKADGIVGAKTTQALGAKYIQGPQPMPKPATSSAGASTAASTPEAVLMGTLIHELKEIQNKIDVILDNAKDPNLVTDPTANYVKSVFVQAYNVLGLAAQSRAGADSVATQVKTAMVMIAGGLAGAIAKVAAAGCDSSELSEILIGLNGTSGQVADVVKQTLQGQLAGGLSAGKTKIQGLLDPFT